MAGYIIPTLVSCFLTLVFIVSGDNSDDSHALVYDQDAFLAGVAKNRNFVMFYAPWCGHCKNLSPTWDQLAKIYNKAEDSPVVIAKVDCTVHTALCAAHDVVGFPTLKLFEVGGESFKRYSGKRDIDSLKSYIQEQVQGEGSQDFEKQEEKKPEVPEPKSSLVVLTDENFEEKLATGYAFVKFYAPWCGHCKRLAPTWDDLADGFSDDNKVSIAKIDCTQSSVVCKQFEIRGYPTLLWFKDGQKVEQYQGQRTHEALKKFVSDRMAADSGEEGVSDQEEEKIPETVEVVVGKVQDLTADNFKSFISSKLVFVKFFAPWCGHCKRLAPTWEDLAKESKELPISIAKVDCTQHKSVCEENQVRGYPTLKIFNKGEFVKDYKGGRDLESLYNFVKKQSETHDEL